MLVIEWSVFSVLSFPCLYVFSSSDGIHGLLHIPLLRFSLCLLSVIILSNQMIIFVLSIGKLIIKLLETFVYLLSLNMLKLLLHNCCRACW